jgi:hypothetical protein
MAKQGSFISQIQDRKGLSKERDGASKKFNWKKNYGQPERDYRPQGKLDGKPIEQPEAPLGRDIPQKANGQIDLAEINDTLTKAVKAQRKGKQ